MGGKPIRQLISLNKSISILRVRAEVVWNSSFFLFSISWWIIGNTEPGQDYGSPGNHYGSRTGEDFSHRTARDKNAAWIKAREKSWIRDRRPRRPSPSLLDRRVPSELIFEELICLDGFLSLHNSSQDCEEDENMISYRRKKSTTVWRNGDGPGVYRNLSKDTKNHRGFCVITLGWVLLFKIQTMRCRLIMRIRGQPQYQGMIIK